MAIIWIIVAGIAWAFFSEIVIMMVEVGIDRKLGGALRRKTVERWR